MTAAFLSADPMPAGLGILVVGHGTADPVGAAETRLLAEQVAGVLPGRPVELGFLEVIGPTVAEGLGRLRDRGCREVIAAPLLLFTAGHARRDLPGALVTAAAHLRLPVRQADALGAHREMILLACRRRREALADRAPVPPDAEVLVFVGRGASDPDTPAQLRAFLAATLADGDGSFGSAGGPKRRTEVGFVSAARPTVSEALRAAVEPSADGVRPTRVVVQPYLLFSGHVEGEVRAAVEQARLLHPDVDWVLTPRLGPEAEVARALVTRALEAAARR